MKKNHIALSAPDTEATIDILHREASVRVEFNPKTGKLYIEVLDIQPEMAGNVRSRDFLLDLTKP